MRKSWRVAAMVAAAGLALNAISGAAARDDRSDANLTSAKDQVRWNDETVAVAGTNTHVVTVALSDDVWSKSGRVQIGIVWVSEEDDLELRVTAGDQAYESKGIVSTAESVLVGQPGNGTYTVEVSSSSTRDVSYDVVAEVEYPAKANPPRPLLPDLTSLPARNLHFAVGAYLVNPIPGGTNVTTCYPEEIVEQGATKCLRFDQIIENVGDGAFELRYQLPPEDAHVTDDPAANPNLVTFEALMQRIYWSDGSKVEDRRAADYEFHPAHAHFHYKNFAVSKLSEAGADGIKLTGGRTAGGRKNGFCMVDVENTWFGLKGDAARTYIPPACLAPTEGDENVNGISRGWADVYNWYLADQFIEVSGLADGFYVLETVADPDGTIVELDETNNCTAVLIRLSEGVTKAELVRPLGAC